MSEAQLPRAWGAGDIVVSALKAEGVDTVFGIVGSHVVAIYDALRRAGDVRTISARHEGSVSFMAAAYARLTGRTGIGLVTAGPGVLNAMNGIAQAQFSAWPVLLLAGGPPVGARAFELHGLAREDYCRDAVAPLVKFAVRVTDLSELGPVLSQAITTARSGRPGPAYVEIPLDLFRAEPLREWSYAPRAVARQAFAAADVDAARMALSTADHPLVVIDRGAAEGAQRSVAFSLAEAVGAGLAVTRDALGAVDERHPLYRGVVHEHMFARGGFAAVEAAGCCVLIGADPGSANHYRVTSRSRGPVFLLQSVAADDEGSRVCAVPAPTGCDIEPVVVSTESNLFVATLAGVRERLDDSDISVVDAGNHEVWARTMLPITGRRCCIGGSDWASMGFALPTAIAARAVETDARIVCVTGDGCLLMSLTDLSTFFELGGPSILIVLNDSEYGMMSDVQRAGFGTAYASELPRVDVAAVARALGGEGARIETRSQLAPALDQAFSARRPFVLDVVCASPAMSDLGYFQTRSTCP